MNLHLRIAIIAALCGLASSTAAATFTVTRQDDPSPNGCLPGDCSLREAVLAANATTAADTILLGSGSYLLTRTCVPDTAFCQDLDVTQPLTIRGTGSAMTGIRNGISQAAAAGKDRRHARLIESTGVALKLQFLTLRHGYLAYDASTTGQLFGGCLFVNGGSLEAVDTIVDGCAINEGGGSGGGIALHSAGASLTKVKITGNTADRGGGIHAGNSSNVTGSNTTISGNSAQSVGGGVLVAAGSSLRLGGGSVVANNMAIAGGGIATSSLAPVAVGGTAPTASDRLRVEGNTASDYGGGLLLASAVPFGSASMHEASNLTVVGNVAGGNGGGMYLHVAGSVSSGAGPSRVRDVEFAENDANGNGGGLWFSVGNTGAETELSRLSLWGNTAVGRGGGMHVSGTVAIRNISSTGNQAGAGGSALYTNSVNLPTIAHFTSYGDIGASVRVDSPASFRASVFDGTCVGPMIDQSANFARTGSSGCPGSVASDAQLALAFGQYGGGHPVVGITSASSVLRNTTLNGVGATDARNYLRVGTGDSGAFEFDGIPQ